ncbi:MAG TPA: GNAT family N-acetyltransferase [Rhizomicrobium sp.]
MQGINIRDADLARDRPAMHGFIMGSQRHEYAIEPNRRLDPPVAEEHLARLIKYLEDHEGRIFIAEDANGAALGWGVVGAYMGEIFIVPEERNYAYIFELFVVEAMRGKGIGRALIVACEDWAKAEGFKTIQIGVLSRNESAAGLYRSAGYADYAIELRKYLR